jgi:hypothetical protein
VKTQIIYLDPHDDRVSARDKLGWAQAPHIILVWPKYGRVLTRRLDLVLLQRYAQQRSSQIGIITHDPDVLENAEILSIPVFDSIDHIAEDKWPRRDRTYPELSPEPGEKSEELAKPPELSPTIEISEQVTQIVRPTLTGIAVIAILLLVFTLAQSAEVILSPATSSLKVDMAVLLDPQIEEPTIDAIPSRTVSILVTDSLRVPTTGTIALPAVSARGEVVLTNLTSESISIPIGTGLRASSRDELRFLTLEAVELDAEEGAQVVVTVEAVSPGPSGNIPEGVIDGVEGVLGLSISASNPERITGGVNEVRSAVAAADYRMVEEQLIDLLLERSFSELPNVLETGEALTDRWQQVARIIRLDYDRQIGDPADTLSLTVEMEVSSQAYRDEDLKTSAHMILQASLGLNEQLLPNSFRFVDAPTTQLSKQGQIMLEAKIEQDTFQSVDRAAYADLIRAKPIQTALQLLEDNADLSDSPEIVVRPSWFRRLPWLSIRITFSYSWDVN